MQIRTMAAVAMSVASVLSVHGDATLVYKPDDQGVRDWSSVGGWWISGGAAYGNLPGSRDTVYISGKDFAWPDPLVIPQGCAAKALSLQIGGSSSADAVLRIDEGGSFKIHGSGGSRWFSVGYSGRGVLVNDGGEFSAWASSGLAIGDGAGAFGAFTNVSGNTWHHGLRIGNKPGSTGVVSIVSGLLYENSWQNPAIVKVGIEGYGLVEMSGGTMDGCREVSDANGGGLSQLHLGAGDGGEGMFRLSGGKLKGYYVYIGSATNALGRMEVTGGTYGCNRTFYVGYDGTGSLDVKAGLEQGELRIGGTGTGSGTMTIRESATNKVCYVYGHTSGNAFVGGGSAPDAGSGELAMKGGVLWLSHGQATFSIGDGVGLGAVTGWGEIHAAALATDWDQSLKIVFGSNGTVRADGYGIDRTLDFTTAYMMTNTCPAALRKTNGWYAVNRGCVHLPYVFYTWSPVVSRCLGDTRSLPEPTLVNSVRVSVVGTGEGTLHAGVYASDRTDCHLESLPGHKRIIGVWRIGSHKENAGWPGWTGGTPVTTFSKASVKFRYDASRLAGRKARLVLYRREDGGIWKRRAVKEVTGGETPVIDADELPRLTEDPANIGTFALVEQPLPGSLIIVR